MIKCFVVKCIDNRTPCNEDNFITGWSYIAKISSNNPNTFAVLDNNKNWIPFKLYSINGEFNINHRKLYFDILDEFDLSSKKELNKYVPTTHFYD